MMKFSSVSFSSGGQERMEPNVCLNPMDDQKWIDLCRQVDKPSVSQISPPFMPDPPVKDRCGRHADHFVRLQAGTARRTPTKQPFEETLDGVKP